MKTLPARGRDVPAASWLLPNATASVASIPMTSPVERISGPRTTSTPGNLPKGKTDSLTAYAPSSSSFTSRTDKIEQEIHEAGAELLDFVTLKHAAAQ